MEAKKTILIICMFLLLIWTASATIVDNPKPLITVKYNETVNILDVTLKNLDTGNYTEVELVENISSMNFTYQPVTLLAEGDYIFSVLASDEWGNQKETQSRFTVEITFSVELLEPSFGVSPTSVFDAVFSTSEDAVCKYYNEVPRPFASFNDINITGGKTHTILDFDWSDYVERYGNIIFIACNTSFGTVFGENGEYMFELGIDETDPDIKRLEATPNPIIEGTTTIIDGQESAAFITHLEAETDDETICKYSTTTNNYVEMENKFSGFDEEEYKTLHELNIILFEDYKDYNYSVACENLAGRISATEIITITVNTGIGLSTTSFEPSGYLSANSVTLIAETNKNADCSFYNSSNALLGATTDKKTHTLGLTLEDGQHTFRVECKRLGESTTRTTSFTIDTTPPINLTVNDSSTYHNFQKTKKNDKLRVRFSAVDPESEIDYYKYRLEDSSENVISDWEEDSPDRWIWVDGLDLANGTYKFRINVTNNAGLSSTALSDGITVDTSMVIIIPETCYDNIQNQGESDIDCGGPCITENKTCDIREGCEVNNDCLSNYCHTNNTCQVSLCENNMRDSGETDVDCGGICVGENKTCDLGQGCNFGSDCTIGFCGTNNLCRTNPDDIDEDGTQNEEDEDIDGDGISNNQDPDDDNDGLCDTYNSTLNDDMCTGNDDDDDSDGVNDPDDKDIDNDWDNDEIINEEDEDIDGDDISNNQDPDDDNDGLCDTYNSTLNNPNICAGQDDDDDNDGTIDWLEEDSNNDLDNDGIENEKDEDMDGDGITNNQDPDDDNDGLCDKADDPLNNPAVCTGEDKDDDNDGIDDLEEDNDNDGIPDWWEIEHGLNPFVSDSNEIRRETGLTYYEEYMRELEAQRIAEEEMETDVLDEDEGTSTWVILFLIFAILAVLLGGSYFGYKEFIAKKEKFESKARMFRPFPQKQAFGKKQIARIPIKSRIMRKAEIRERIKKRMQEKVMRRSAKRKKVFTAFETKEEKPKQKEEAKKPEIKKIEKKEVKKPEKKKGWVTLEELKKPKSDVLDKLSGFIKSKDVREELSKLGKKSGKIKETKHKESKEDIFKELEKISGKTKHKKRKAKEDVFDELDKIEKKLKEK